jgi:TatD DNase family protein
MAAMDVFDTHCHLGLDGVVPPDDEHARAVAAGVTGMLVVGIDAASSEQARGLARLPGVRWSAGLHPNDASRFDAEWPAIEALARAPGCAALGETGMDCYRDRTPLDQQERSLRAHLQLARELDLPVVFHCRDAFAPLFAVLRSEPRVRGVMHCFSGGYAEAREALDLGLYLSFAGPLTYPKNDALRAVAASAPAERVLVETDAPFLPPQRLRGRRNEPAYVLDTLGALAQARGIALADAAALTFANATALFGGSPASSAQRPAGRG